MWSAALCGTCCRSGGIPALGCSRWAGEGAGARGGRGACPQAQQRRRWRLRRGRAGLLRMAAEVQPPRFAALQGDDVNEMRLKLLSSSPESYPFKDE